MAIMQQNNMHVELYVKTDRYLLCFMQASEHKRVKEEKRTEKYT